MNQLHVACERGDLDEVTSLLSNEECDINALNGDGDSPFHIACEYCHLEIVKVLIKDQKCDLNIQNTFGNTPLHLACNSKSLAIFRLLLEQKCSTNIPNKNGETAQNISLNEDGDCLLHIACQWGDVNIVTYLITDERCNPNVRNVHLNTPLHLACYWRNLSIIRFLLEQKCSTSIPNKKGETPQNISLNEDGDCLLHVACQWGDLDIVRYLITDERCNPNVQSYISENTPLHIAAMYGQDDTIVQLLSCKECNLNAENKEGNTPMHIAVRQSETAAIARLLAHWRCNINVQNEDGETPLHIAVWDGHDDTIFQLLSCKECNPNVQDKEGDAPLHIAVRENRTPVISQLLANKPCNPNVQNKDGDTPLHCAMWHGHEDTITQLLSCKECDPTAQNKEGYTSLHLAVKQNRTSVISQLLTTDINAKNKVGDTSLHTAVRQGQDDTIIKILSCKECDPNVLNGDDDTPLHLAVRENNTAAISELLAHQQCNMNSRNKFGDTPLHSAVKAGKITPVSQLLTVTSCDPNIQNTDGDTPLHIAVRQEQEYTIRRLLFCDKCNLDVQNMNGDTPLHIAVKKNKAAAFNILLAHQQCNINVQDKYGDTPLHIAVRKNITPAMSQLLTNKQWNPNVQNKNGDTPFHSAVWYGHKDTITQLLSCKECDPNLQNKEGNTLLHLAVRQNKTVPVFHILLSKKCDPNIQNTDGDTPLHIAVRQAQDDTIRTLLSCDKCDPNVQNREGDTPLHIACYKKLLKNIQQLLQIRCSTNTPNKKGETAQNISLNEDGDCLFHIACQWGDMNIVRYLITDERCNPNAKNKKGATPLHIACYRKSLLIIKLLLKEKCSTNIPNKRGWTAQEIPLNEDEDCLLHIACQWGDVDIVRYLITDERCNPNVQSWTSKNTPLHIVAKNGQDDTIAQLLSCKECNPIAQNKAGDTPLHFAVRQSTMAAVYQLLVHKQCDPNVQNKDGDTPLHISAKENRTLAISQLLSSNQCNPNLQNKEDDTPLHIAVRHGQIDTITQLSSCKECNPNIQNMEGDTPLHCAVRHGQDVAIVQLLLCKECNPNFQNKEGDTPLHFAVKQSKKVAISRLLAYQECNPNVKNKEGDTPLHIVVRDNRTSLMSQLLSNEQCNPNVQDKDGDTPLHIAVRKSITSAMSKLLANEQCDPNVQDKYGDTPLHIAVREDITPAISQLLSNKQCDPNVQNYHLTPLLSAIKCNNRTVATALLQHKDCDPTLCDQHGNTPLHLACIVGESKPEMVEVAKQLLSSVDIDPSCVNNAGQTPIELTTNYQLIQAISHMIKCKTKQSVQTYINMFVVGNPETGKSTLVKAICKEATSILWKIVPKQLRRVKNVPPHTAGIIPTTFRSKTFGNTVLYDLAGQVEYYTSHAAVIRSTVISTPPAFIVVVNLSESEEKISQTLRYWCSFIDNHASQSSAPPQVILVGSHADVVKSTGGSVQDKMTQLSALLKQLPASFHFTGQVALDCRDPASKGLRLFCSLVNQSCTVLREKADVDLRCHVLYAFLQDRFNDKVACTVSDVAACVKENRELLPQSSSNLIPLVSTLSDKGLLLLVKGSEDCGDWWIILQKQALLSEICGAIFAPKSFRQHKDLAWSTGVVPSFKLENEFPDHDSNMVSGFLTHLEFCFKIEDRETLSLLKDDATNVEDTSPNVSEEYYFFPALVSVNNPLDVWEENETMCCKCGWFYRCIRPDQFLTTQFLHVLILRLAFIFALQLDPGDCCEDSLSLRRKCSVWKHGIGWLNRVQIETVVEVGLQYQSVMVMMRCPKGKEAKCAQLRAEVIQKILEAKDEHCKAVKMSESFVHPSNVKHPFTNNVDNIKFYSLTEIARAIICKTEEANALDQRGRNTIPVQDLLLFDPCNIVTSRELLMELFSKKHSMDEIVRIRVLETLNTTPWPAVESKITCNEDTSKPKFANSERASVMNQFDPVTLHIHQTDETTMKALQLFARQVVLILHTCNANEYWAALEKLEPLNEEDGGKIRDCPIIYPQVGSVIGWFAGYRAAVVRTGEGNKCRDELTTALTKLFPNSKVIIAAGIAYANNREYKFADVLISDQIENFVQYKIVDGKITNRGPREQIDPNVQRVFENPARDWSDMKNFTCADDNRTSVAHIGCIVSAPTLVQDEVLRDQLMKHTPDCIGGEMEGWVLLELKRTLKGQHNKDIEVIVIKGVADYGDCTKGDQWQWTTAKAAINCIHYCLNKSGGIEFGAIPQPAAIKDMEPEAISNTTPPGTRPTLPELLRFTCTDKRVVNIAEEVGTKYVQFGTFLLDDRTGSRVKNIAHKHSNDAEWINTEILQEWLTGRGKQPVTWVTLVEVLHDIELSSLAGEIEVAKCLQDQSQKTY